MKPGASTPRETALDVLDRLDRPGPVLDAVLDAVLENRPDLTRKDRALVMALVYGVLRHRGRLDYVIAHFSTTKFSKIRPRVKNILRLGVFQLLFMTRTPPGLAVNSSVEMAKTTEPPWVVKFVNGLLRTVDRKGRDLPPPDPEQDPVRALAVGHSHPEWLVKRWISRFGFEEASRLCRAGNDIAPITIRVNTLRATSAQVEEAWSGQAESLEPCRFAPGAFHVVRPARPVFEMPGFNQGWFAVQDEASQLACLLLGVRPGQRILDACAGLGAKTGCLAQRMENQGAILALDLEASKLARLEGEMKRLGVDIAAAAVRDFTRPPDPGLGLFDAVLVDAPCSGLGVIRKNPDAKWTKTEADVLRHAAVQSSILDNAASLVRPGGALVYSVCTFEPEETVDAVRSFLKDHPEYAMDAENAGQFLPAEARGMAGPEGFFTSLPHRHGLDGFFAARMRRNAC